MITEKKMLDKLKWDKNYSSGSYQVGIWDNITKSLLWVDFNEMIREEGNKFSFEIWRIEKYVDIPYHRIKQIKKDGT